MARARNGATGFFRDFRDFLNRGNVVELAVAVVVGTAFGQVVEAIVNLVSTAVLNPVLQQLQIERLQDWPLGSVIVAVINFLLIAFLVFLIVRVVERFKGRPPAGPDPVEVQSRLADAVNRLVDRLEQ
ncbi:MULTISPECIES: large conductance mechanosensitive channel protein MscL [unclassified Leptolyngbya]|uniref:large conductance mechanosensitive channel protein MscL n=1 Tax=unclassified Leptolyngbya TaxID=2650499 RepID=UPI00168562ED|nr:MULTISPECIES: large conductance mechanosensitive channel protein MscL [unclassified Leptolyngbya]MBD1913072.1 large conductance mechanosensitive channel protein MscL [Leptolyngbya sp. FACHB-8]MBD2154427.1 large conductance mechanosensitive channel protein MscL [Leptolyngbya sp. FACHB-16]